MTANTAQTDSEREVKLDIWSGFTLPDLTSVDVTLAPRPDVRLVAIYYDTADLRLLRAGITLRYRRDRQAESEAGWTLKLPVGSDKARLDRTEYSWATPPGDVPDEAQQAIFGMARGRPLLAVAEMVTERHRWWVDGEHATLAELVDDDVSVTAQGRTQTFRQIEIELTGDPSRAVDRVVKRLCEAGAVPSRPEPKVQRALAHRLATTGPARVPRAGPASSLSALVAATIQAGLDRMIEHDPGIRLRQDDEFVHQARVATRRLRSDLKTVHPALDADWVTATRSELRWLADRLGSVRDADVLAARFETRRNQLAPSDIEPFDRVIAGLVAQRDEAYRALDEAMRDARYLALLDRLERAATDPPFARGDDTGGLGPDTAAADALPALVHRPWHSLSKAVEAAGNQPSDDKLHQIRIRSKQLRYASEAAADVVGRPAERLAARVAALQEVLGDQHDAVTAEAWLRHVASGASAAEVLVVGQLIAAERIAASGHRGEWRPAWDAVRRAGRWVP